MSSQAPALSNQGVQDTVISQVTPEAPSVLDAFEAEMPSSAEKERRSTEFTERMEDAAVAVDDLKDQVVVAGQEHGRRGFLKKLFGKKYDHTGAASTLGGLKAKLDGHAGMLGMGVHEAFTLDWVLAKSEGDLREAKSEITGKVQPCFVDYLGDIGGSLEPGGPRLDVREIGGADEDVEAEVEVEEREEAPAERSEVERLDEEISTRDVARVEELPEVEAEPETGRRRPPRSEGRRPVDQEESPLASTKDPDRAAELTERMEDGAVEAESIADQVKEAAATYAGRGLLKKIFGKKYQHATAEKSLRTLKKRLGGHAGMLGTGVTDSFTLDWVVVKAETDVDTAHAEVSGKVEPVFVGYMKTLRSALSVGGPRLDVREIEVPSLEEMPEAEEEEAVEEERDEGVEVEIEDVVELEERGEAEVRVEGEEEIEMPAVAEAKGGVFGWIKGLFTSKSESEPAPEAELSVSEDADDGRNWLPDTNMQVVRMLGQGGQGRPVYELRSSSGETFAGKRSKEDWQVDFTLDEADKMAKLPSDPNILNMVGLAQVKDMPTLVLEYAENGDLSQVFKALESFSFDADPKLNDQKRKLVTKYLVKGSFKGLAAMHKAGLMHGDIKAENVFLGGDLAPKVADFDTMRTEDELAEGAPLKGIGSATNMAPEGANYLAEQVDALAGDDKKDLRARFDKGLTAKSDIWSMGEMLLLGQTGKTALEQPSGEREVNRDGQEKRKALNLSDDSWHDSLTGDQDFVDFIKATMKYDPEKRVSAEDALQLDYLKDVDEEEAKALLRRLLQ